MRCRARATSEGGRACFRAAAALARGEDDAALLARAALGHAGLAIAIIDLDEPAIALLQEALAALGDAEPVLRSQLLGRLAVELYYAPSRDRSEALSSQAVTVARDAGDPRAVAAALNARHVALWRPDRLEERLAAADELIAVAGAAGESAARAAGPQLARRGPVRGGRTSPNGAPRCGATASWRCACGCRAFAWYTPLWAAVEAVHAGRYDEGAELRERARVEGRRAGDRNADLFAEMLLWSRRCSAATGPRSTSAWSRTRSPPPRPGWRGAGPTRGCSPPPAARTPRASSWPSSPPTTSRRCRSTPTGRPAMAECAEACVLLGDAGLAIAVYERLLPYADRSVTSGRAVTSVGSTQRLLAGLAAVLDRTDEAIARHDGGDPPQ